MRATLRGSSKTASCATQAVQPPARRDKARAKAGHSHSRSRSLSTIRSLLLPAALMATSACASSSYMGISLVPDASDAELQSLASRARAGEKQAQLELGTRFEEGNGVPLDIGKAKALYGQAAADTGGTMWVYMPSPGNGAPGRVVSVDTGPKQAGLDEAKKRLGFVVLCNGSCE
ncbi:hypothetical protein OOT33_03725 [Sphingobium sp. DEHP117]|uniref:hypothetical protein n=1 Tax=Sphingobium sp. DEHP117 TaxID=2993436 RepID=UPI0027D53A8B|nr:hypothetical protein [Sphingobium sp. DEHP117]MDQ4419548.1 hypothetical protein [Sphingobium sp. DEHP117]